VAEVVAEGIFVLPQAPILPLLRIVDLWPDTNIQSYKKQPLFRAGGLFRALVPTGEKMRFEPKQAKQPA
jgi:hypothetical protein